MSNRCVKDITGQRFGRLVAIKPVQNAHGNTVWECQCDCGNITFANGASLRKGNKKSCGCFFRERLVDLTGKTFGKLTVIRKAGNYKSGAALWKCRCECGNITYATGTALKNGSKKSCGCLKKG